MSKSVTRAVLAYKHLIIGAIAFSGLFTYMMPDAVAQFFSIRTNGVSVDIGDYGVVSVSTDGTSVNIDQERIRVITPGQDITIPRTGFQWWSFLR